MGAVALGQKWNRHEEGHGNNLSKGLMGRECGHGHAQGSRWMRSQTQNGHEDLHQEL